MPQFKTLAYATLDLRAIWSVSNSSPQWRGLQTLAAYFNNLTIHTLFDGHRLDHELPVTDHGHPLKILLAEVPRHLTVGELRGWQTSSTAETTLLHPEDGLPLVV
jgi:hypothetical protein